MISISRAPISYYYTSTYLEYPVRYILDDALMTSK
jgi:hypothetical protein